MNSGNLSIADVLKHPLFLEAEVVAGLKGLSRNVRWVHILESAENAEALNGKELILATGVEFGSDPVKLLKYLEEITKREASGLCLRVGHYVSAVPPEVLEAANKIDFPLIVFKKSVRFVDITLSLHETIVNRHVQSLTLVDRYARDLQKLSLEGKHLSGILNHLQENVAQEVYFITCDGFFLSVPSLRPPVLKKMVDLFQPLFSEESKEQPYGRLRNENREFMYQPIQVMGEVLAFLLVSRIRSTQDDLLGQMLDYTASAIAQILLRGRIVRERTLDNEGRILDDILQGRVTGEGEIREALGIEGSLKPFYLILVFEEVHDTSGLYEDVSSAYSNLLANFRFIASHFGFRSIFHKQGKKTQILLISMTRINDWQTCISKAIERCKEIDIKAFKETFGNRFGVSRLSQSFTEIRHAVHEAEQALLLYPIVKSPFYHESGVFRLFAEIKNSHVLHACLQDYLSPILKYDEEHGAELFLTLRKFLEHNLSKKETADALYIHRQTLYHRLDKIEELIGNYNENPAQRLCLELAFYLFDWLQP